MAWRFNNLTTLTGGPRAAFRLAAHANPLDVNTNEPTKHVFCQGLRDDGFPDGHIHEFWWDGNWHPNDLTDNTGAPLATGVPSSYMFRGDRSKHVIYADGNSRIHELWWDGDWHHNDLTSAAHNAPLSTGSPFGYEYSFGGSVSPRFISQRVVYATFGNQMQLLFWDPDNGWQHTPLTSEGVVLPPTAYVFAVQSQASQRVLYLDSGHIRELVWNEWGPNNQSWHLNDLTEVLSGAPLADNPPVGLMHDLEFTLHVFYVSKEQLYELWWNNLGWHVNNLTALTASRAPTGTPLAYVHLREGTLNVNYRGVDSHIHRLWRDEGKEWNPANKDDLTITAGGAPLALTDPVGFPFFQRSGHLTQHIFYTAEQSPVSHIGDVIELTDGTRFE